MFSAITTQKHTRNHDNQNNRKEEQETMAVPKWDHIVRKKGEIEEQVPGLVAKQTRGETNGGRSHRGVDGGRNYGGARPKAKVMSNQGGAKGKKEPKQAEGVKERGAVEGLEACGGGRATTDLRTSVGIGTHTW